MVIIGYFYLATLLFFIAEDGSKFMASNCELLIADSKISNTSNVEIDLFDWIHDFDESNNKLINRYMCTDKC